MKNLFNILNLKNIFNSIGYSSIAWLYKIFKKQKKQEFKIKFFKDFYFQIFLIFLISCSPINNKLNTKKFPIYGNYCGSSNAKKSNYKIPVDKTDLACKNFNKCSRENHHQESCNHELIQKFNDHNPLSNKEIIVRKLIVDFIENNNSKS